MAPCNVSSQPTDARLFALFPISQADFQEVLSLHPDFELEVQAQSKVARETVILDKRRRDSMALEGVLA